MAKNKVIIKEKRNKNNDSILYVTKHKGDDGICFTMAMGFGVSLAKQCGLSQNKVLDLVKDIYKETEDVNDD